MKLEFKFGAIVQSTKTPEELSCVWIAYNSNHEIVGEMLQVYGWRLSSLVWTIKIEEAVGLALRCGWTKACFYSDKGLFYGDSKVIIDFINDNQQVVRWKIYAALTKF